MLDLASIIRIVFAPTSVAWGFLIFILLVFLASLWSVKAPGFPGNWKGPHRVTLFYDNRRYHRYLYGGLTDATSYLLDRFFVEAFKRFAMEDWETLRRAAPNSQAASELNRRIEAVRKGGFEKHVLVLGLRTRRWTKHVFLVFFDSQEEPGAFFTPKYVSESRMPVLTFPLLEYYSRGSIQFDAVTYPKPWRIPGIGRATVHICLPIPIQHNPASANPLQTRLPEMEDATYLALNLRSAVEPRIRAKLAEKKVKEAEREMRRIMRETHGLKTEYGVVRRFILHHLFPGERLDKASLRLLQRAAGGRVISDFTALVGLFIGGLAASQYGFDTLMGAGLGGILGAAAGRLLSR